MMMSYIASGKLVVQSNQQQQCLILERIDCLPVSPQGCIRRHNRERSLDVKPNPLSRLSLSDRQEAARESRKVELSL